MSINPIETIYNGYKFRSRLEARWAVFFDAAGIPYEYEPQGYQLSDGESYLPDFYLPWFHAFVEIKPKSINNSELLKASIKCQKLFEHPDCVVLLCCGDPMDDNIRIYCNETDDGGGGESWFRCKFLEGIQYEWLWGTSKHCISIVIGEKKDRERDFFSSSWNSYHYYQDRTNLIYRDDFKSCKLKARQARFEYGETPTAEVGDK